MATLTKTKKPAAKKPARNSSMRRGIAGLSPRRTPPPASGTVGDVLAMGAAFGKGADWDLIEAAHAARDL